MVWHDNMQAGARIVDNEMLAATLSQEPAIQDLIVSLTGQTAKPVRAILFDKNPKQNWTLGWHQDRTICVLDRIETIGFGPWSKKHDLVHVEPPFEILNRMLTLRIHLDDVNADNAPLLVSPGTHLLGRVDANNAKDIATSYGSHACLAKAGDIWAYATPILHASETSFARQRRRVLQVDFSPDELPNRLQWSGI